MKKRDPYAKSLGDRKFRQRIVPVKRQVQREADLEREDERELQDYLHDQEED